MVMRKKDVKLGETLDSKNEGSLSGQTVGSLRFRSVAFEGKQSVEDAVKEAGRSGIYAYEFTDGTWYVGKSKNLPKRHIEHVHEYKHRNPPLTIKSMFFAPVSPRSAEALDRSETDAITWFAEKGYELNNVMKTSLPRGSRPVEIDTGMGFGVDIPWTRRNRPRLTGTRQLTTENGFAKEKLVRFERLKGLPYWDELLESLTRYVSELIPAPEKSYGTLWTLTALPSKRNGNRTLCCLSCGNLETLTLFDVSGDCCGFANVKLERHLAMFRRLPCGVEGYEADYRAARGVTTFSFDDLDGLARLMDREWFLDASYRLVAELMRKGPSMYRKYSCDPFADEVIHRMNSKL